MCKQNKMSNKDTAHETKVAIERCVIPEKQSIKIENPSWGGGQTKSQGKDQGETRLVRNVPG